MTNLPINKIMLKFRDFARLFGLEIKPSNLRTRQDLRLQQLLKELKTQLVLDVGANTGQFAKSLIIGGFQGRILSFEAIPHVWNQLAKSAQNASDLWQVAPTCALGESTGTHVFYITAESQSSSLMKPSQNLTTIESKGFSYESIEVDMKRLDEIVSNNGWQDDIFLKLDVQGSELMVLRGASGILSNVKGILVEMSLVQLYDGQPLFHEVDGYLSNKGYKIWDIHPFFRHSSNGRLLQFDAIYVRSEE